jgi:predicted flap endonuclease-1-like 5' DNA nuclease
MTNMTHIIETALLVLAAYLVGCVLGYGLRRMLHAASGTREITLPPQPLPATAPRAPTPAARLAARVDEPLAVPKTTAAARPGHKAAEGRPPALTEARDGKPDNLKQIKGIGPKIEASLHGLGVFHFDQIATWSKPNAEWVETHLAFKGRVRRERWIEQALELMRVGADA